MAQKKVYEPRIMLPRISLAGTDFYIDIKLWELRQVDRWYNNINLSSLDATPDGDHLLVFFNKKTKTQFTNNKIQLLPPYVVCLKIPHELEVDPVGYARKLGEPDEAFLHLYPALDFRKAQPVDVNQFLPGRRVLPKKPRIVQAPRSNQVRK